MATKQSPIQNIKKNLQQFGLEEKIARAKLKAMPQSFNPEQGQALINATDAKVNQLENELAGVSGENIDQRIESLLRQQERGSLTPQQEKELDLLLTQSENTRINTLQLQYQAGTLDATGEQELNDLLDQQEQASQITPSESGQSLNAYGMPSSSAQKKIQDAKYNYLLSKIGPVADSPINNTEITPRIRLAQNIYGAENIEIVKGKPQLIVSEEMRQQSGFMLPATMPLPSGFGRESLERFGVNMGAGIAATAAAVPLAGLATAAGGPPAGLATLGTVEAAGGAGSEFFNVNRAIGELEKTGILSPSEIKSLKSKEIPMQTTMGGVAGLTGAALSGLPGALKGAGKYLERAGTRGEAETLTKRAIQEAYLTEQIKNQAAENPYNAAAIIKNAIERNVDNINITADSYFTKARQASEALTKDGQAAGKDFADVTDWWNEFSSRFQDKPEVVKQMGDALGISREIPGAPSQIIKEYGPAPITFKKYSDADLVEAGVIEDYYTREKLQFQKATLDERIAMAEGDKIPELELKRDITQKQISDISKKIDGALKGKEIQIETSPTEGFTITPQTIPGTGFVETLAKAKVGKPPVTSTKIAKTGPTTVFEPNAVIEGQVVGKISPFDYSQGYMTLNKIIDEAQMSDPLLYSQLVKAKVAYQKPLNIQIAKEQLEKTTDFTKFAGQQTRMGYTDFKATPKIPQGTAGAPYVNVRQGFQTLEEGYNKIPTSLRNKVSGPVEIVNQKLFTPTGSPTFKQTEAKQINEAIVNNYGDTSPRILQDISDSITNQAIYRTKAVPTSTDIAGSKITPELYEKASAITPQQQKALQAKGVSLDIDKTTLEAAPGESTQRINLGGKTGILNKSAEEKDVLSNLVGEGNYELSQAPLQNLLTIQEASSKPITIMDKVKQFFNDTTLNRIGIAGRPGFGTDTGVGAGIGTLVGGAAGTVAGNPLAGAGLGGVAGSLIGGNVRPLARAASKQISQMPLDTIESFATNPLVKQGLIGSAEYAATNPNDISEAGSGIMQQKDDILQQILKLRRFTNGNY